MFLHMLLDLFVSVTTTVCLHHLTLCSLSPASSYLHTSTDTLCCYWTFLPLPFITWPPGADFSTALLTCSHLLLINLNFDLFSRSLCCLGCHVIPPERLLVSEAYERVAEVYQQRCKVQDLDDLCNLIVFEQFETQTHSFHSFQEDICLSVRRECQWLYCRTQERLIHSSWRLHCTFLMKLTLDGFWLSMRE